MPKVSVIVPTYDREAYIRETIDSILDQSYRNFEIIVVDDGSTDSTVKILKTYGSRLRLIRQKHAERAVARNTGIEHSRGEHIAFVDSDDVWLPDKLALQIDVLERHPQIVCVYGACRRIDEKSRPLKRAMRQFRGFSGDVFQKLLYRNFVPSPTPLIRRQCFTKGLRFSSKYALYEDWACWLRIALTGHFHFIPTPLAYYRVHARQSVQSARAEEIEKATLSILEDTYKLLPVPEGVRHRATGLAYLRAAYWYLVCGQSATAKGRLQCALKNHPRFLTDPRWLGLKIFAALPALNRSLYLSKLHRRF